MKGKKVMRTIDAARLCELVEARTKHRRQFSLAPGYAEPGYRDPENGIVFGNWNPACGFDVDKATQRRDPVSKLARVLEGNGYEIEWEDEWTTCCDCGKAVRTSSDCYPWTSYYRILNECDLVCLDCLDWEDYARSIENDPRSCLPPEIKPEAFGYAKVNGFYKTGFHPAQNDDPAKVLEGLQAAGHKHVVFRLADKSQFDMRWEAYSKQEEA